MRAEFLFRSPSDKELIISAEKRINPEASAKLFKKKPFMSYRFIHNIAPNEIRIPEIVLKISEKPASLGVYRIINKKTAQVKYRIEGELYYISPRNLDELYFVDEVQP